MDDHLLHIEDVSCWCNPYTTTVEGEDLCIHNSNYERGDTEEVQSLLSEHRILEIFVE